MNLKVVFTILKLICHKVFKKSYQSSPLMLYGQTNKNITTLLYSSKALSMFLKWATSETSYLLRTLMTTKRFFFKSSTTTDSSTFVRIHTYFLVRAPPCRGPLKCRCNFPTGHAETYRNLFKNDARRYFYY